MANHHNSSGDLVVEEKTLFRQVGWKGYSGRFYSMAESEKVSGETVGFQPVYVQIARWAPGEGWCD